MTRSAPVLTLTTHTEEGKSETSSNNMVGSQLHRGFPHAIVVLNVTTKHGGMLSSPPKLCMYIFMYACVGSTQDTNQQ